ncbi:MAG: methylated-DNA--[protein]-cysteine S-methyltransferase [Rhodospirillales bacterium]|nr:methylated-DNA--[protein]-cysteine S-methyltransferase [Rhodospirillales bacterium]
MSHLSLHSPLGALTVFEEDDALVALEWGWAEEGEVTQLLEQTKARLDEYFSGSPVQFEFPTRPAGTDYQQSVWREMSDIPYGETRSYGDLARALKSSPRAVGSACGRNPLPIIIPCHRVLGAGGAMTGFSAAEGIKTKRQLLDLEALALGKLLIA